MLTALAFTLIASTWTATPSADVWVYPHSSNPGGESFMRVWGDGAKATDASIPPSDAFSYGYLEFAIKDLPKGKLKKAELTVWNVPNPELTPSVLKESPLEIFILKGTFAEDSFSFDGAKCGPTETVLGKFVLVDSGASGIQLRVDLLAKDGVFAAALESARTSGKLYVALASKVSPAESRGLIYKISTKESEEKLRPTLSVEKEE